MQRHGLKKDLTLVLYDRRGGSLGGHVADAEAIIDRLDVPVVGCGSSFGAVVLLQLALTLPGKLKGMILIEPPLPPRPEASFLPASFLDHFDETVSCEGGPAAGELFLRTVLGDTTFDRIPKPFQERSKQQWRAIRDDCQALLGLTLDWSALSSLRLPTMLLGGARSAPVFGETLQALHRAIPHSTLEIFPAAGHLLQAEAHSRFNDRVRSFVQSVAPPA